MNGTITYDAKKKQWAIVAAPHIAIRLKRCFGKLTSKQQGVLRLSDTEENARDLEWFLDRYPMVVSDLDRLRSRSAAHKERLAIVDAMLARRVEVPTFDLAIPAREYQRIAAAIAIQTGGLLLCDELGVGKTVSAICMLAAPQALPALVVTMTYLPRQWESEIKRFAPHLRTHILKGTTPYDLSALRTSGKQLALPGAVPDVIITSYSKLADWAETLAPIVEGRTLIFDEIQELRNMGTNRKTRPAKYAAAKHLSEYAARRIGLSGTPIHNYGEEFFAVVDLLRPDVLGTRTEFIEEWCKNSWQAGKEKIANPTAFGTYMRESGLMLRRTRADVGREIPAITKVMHSVEANAEVMNGVSQSCAELARTILKQGQNTRGEKLLASEEFSNRLRQATGIAKAGYVADFVRMVVESGEKVVLFGWHRECFARGTSILMADGSTRAVEDVLVGDKVMGPGSAARTVQSLVRGHGPMVRITPTKGDPWTCSAGHILTFRRGAETVELTAREYLSLSARHQRDLLLYRAPAEVFPNSARAGEAEEPWLLGYWLGDGTSSLSLLQVSSADPEVAAECELIAARWGLRVSSSELKQGTTACRHINLVSSVSGKWGRNALLRIFRARGLARNKHIPIAFKTASVSIRRELLAGLIDSDGHVYPGGSADISNSNRRLLEDAAFVARSLGLAAYIYEQSLRPGSFGTKQVPYRLSISGDITQLPMRVPHKRGTVRTNRKNVLHVGLEADPVDDDDFFGFEVDGDHRFLLADFTVVHNCYNIWLDKLKDLNPVMFTGSESPKQKDEAKEAFISGDAKVLIMSLRSGAGLDGLQKACRTVVYGELDWSPAVHEQGTGRVARDGQPDPVVVYYCITDEGSDPIVIDVLGLKREQLEGVRDPDAEIIERLEVDGDRVKRLAAAYLEQRGIAVPSAEVAA